jgi:hypothetical protein
VRFLTGDYEWLDQDLPENGAIVGGWREDESHDLIHISRRPPFTTT